MGKQKTAPAGAPIGDAAWQRIDWVKARREVRRLQMRIAKAVQEGRWNKAKALQHLLVNSFYAKALAVRRVTTNKGKNTPGVDGVLWKGARAKGRAIAALNRRGYKPRPLRRIYIPKKNGKVLHITPAKELWRMIRRRHPNKPKRWLARKYWFATGRRWVFAAAAVTKKGKRLYEVVRLSAIGIRRHIKIKADANPYLPEFAKYFWRADTIRRPACSRQCHTGSTGPCLQRRFDGSPAGASHKGAFR